MVVCDACVGGVCGWRCVEWWVWVCVSGVDRRVVCVELLMMCVCVWSWSVCVWGCGGGGGCVCVCVCVCE